MSKRQVIDMWVEKEKDDLLEYVAYKLQWWLDHQRARLNVLFYDFGDDLNDWLVSIQAYQKDEPLSFELTLCDQEATVLLAIIRELENA